MPRFFRLEEALRLLPRVEPAIREAVELKLEFDSGDQELKETSRNIMMQGGTRIDPGKLLATRQKRDHAAKRLQELLEEIDQIGAQVKDLSIGLLDFPTLYKGEEVCLCWKLGETGITHWHGATEGFRGRKEIDAEFMENHKGDLPI
jgi:hypothetical protein